MAQSFLFVVYHALMCICIAQSYQFNNSKCPGPLELETMDVQNNFDISKYTGIYYEVAYHDYTQSACASPSCMTSNKTFNASYNAIEDNFVIDCVGQASPFRFEYNLTSIKGYFVGIVHGGGPLDGDYFPDTVVATGNVTTDDYTKKEQYAWVIEYQCKTKTEDGVEFVNFVGINFYCVYSNPPKSMMDEMISVAYEQGLGFYLDKSLYFANQTNCTYPWSSEKDGQINYH